MTTKKELVLAAFDNKPVERVPVSFWFHFLKDEIHSDAFQHPELTETLLAGETKYIDEADPDYVKIMTDGFFPYENETVLGLKSAADFAKIKPLPDDSPWFTRQIEYAKKIVGRNDGRAYFYNVFCAATTVKFMRGDDGETFLADAVKENPDAVKKGLDIISGDLAKLARRVIEEAGVTGIYLSLQNLQGVSRETYDAILAPGEKAILEAANAVSDYQILHICGYAGHRNDLSWYTDYPAKAINWAAVVEGVPLEDGKRLFGGKAVIGGFGNLDNEILYTGTKEEIQAETKRLLAAAGRTGVILGADCTVPRDTDWKHFEWVREAAK